MVSSRRRICFSLLLLAGLLFGVQSRVRADDKTEQPTPEQLEFFEKRIRPIFVTHCYECHSGEKKKNEGSLTVDSRAALLKGGDSGPAIIVGDAEKSLLMIAVRQNDKDLKMPPESKLSAAQIDDLAAWIKMGAADPRVAVTTDLAARPKTGMSLEEGRKFWSFQPVKDPQPPAVKNTAWPRNALDNFTLARMEVVAVSPATDADKRTLLRRVTYDLTGLPPTPEEMAAFVVDDSPQAWERVIDRLLASPRYGERWGRHWLDVVRYADTCGNASDYPVPQAHKYRDWVIAALNRDLPYDQFLREQLAGDLLPSENDAQRFERVTATGYLAIARRFGGDRMGEHHLTLEDTIDNVGRAMLGTSIACARCHDHKFDPFTVSDYYGLYGIFSSTRYPFPGAEVGREQVDFVPLLTAEQIDALNKPHQERLAALQAEVAQLQAAEAEAKKAEETPEKAAKVAEATKLLKEAQQRHAAAAKEKPVISNAYAVAETAAANAKVHLRGDPKRLGDEVQRHFPAILGGQELAADSKGNSGRLQLAHWITAPENPLTARVIVNRVWQYHFGRGVVETPNDFGKQGKAPTHPELLDYLASRLVQNGWSLKSLHKLILMSHTWQLSCNDVAASSKVDPNNELFWRYTRRRLDAESLRDSLLMVSGELDESPAGAHPFPPAHTWGWTQHNPFNAVYETKRRSIYLMQQRLKKNPYLAIFDGADPSSSTAVRLPSTTPLQALFMLNDPFAHQSAAKFAARVIAAKSDEPARIETIYQLTMTRSPSADEARECSEFLKAYREKLTARGVPPPQVDGDTWSALARAILSSNEFAFVD
ncbi:PSD1 and planctomycete cytochrome C domain-containing protein [Anatilimnocola floriformis]|uniref:PSD1 and planctomycete cytochrome C domain-containing protein n=1 Tax=Anatilimnocola floriformis TaxID=2948575 RepID=UPI0020C5AD02|nr:PSD1 and planctomycete cytochrome C domain-containing protein [Anatilimnocola floriformis]